MENIIVLLEVYRVRPATLKGRIDFISYPNMVQLF